MTEKNALISAQQKEVTMKKTNVTIENLLACETALYNASFSFATDMRLAVMLKENALRITKLLLPTKQKMTTPEIVTLEKTIRLLQQDNLTAKQIDDQIKDLDGYAEWKEIRQQTLEFEALTIPVEILPLKLQSSEVITTQHMKTIDTLNTLLLITGIIEF